MVCSDISSNLLQLGQLSNGGLQFQEFIPMAMLSIENFRTGSPQIRVQSVLLPDSEPSNEELRLDVSQILQWLVGSLCKISNAAFPYNANPLFSNMGLKIYPDLAQLVPVTEPQRGFLGLLLRLWSPCCLNNGSGKRAEMTDCPSCSYLTVKRGNLSPTSWRALTNKLQRQRTWLCQLPFL